MSNEASISAAKSTKAPSVWPFFAVSLALLLLFWIATLWLTRWQGGDTEPEEAVRAEFRTKTLAELRADDAKKLESYAWVDRAKGSVQIPISEAMKLVLPGLNQSKPRAAYPVATPAPVPAASATPSLP
jgi:hypothetical protein